MRTLPGAGLVALCVVFGMGPSRVALARDQGDLPFVPALRALLAQCRSTANVVGYAVPCPTRIPPGLVAFGGRPGCMLDIIGPAKPCANSAFLWRGWVVGSSTTTDEHLVLVASPHPISNYAKLVNGPAWYPAARVRMLGWVRIKGWRMREIFVPPATNDGSAFANHLVLAWTARGHTYAVGFHDVRGIPQTLALDVALADGIKLTG